MASELLTWVSSRGKVIHVMTTEPLGPVEVEQISANLMKRCNEKATAQRRRQRATCVIHVSDANGNTTQLVTIRLDTGSQAKKTKRSRGRRFAGLWKF